MRVEPRPYHEGDKHDSISLGEWQDSNVGLCRHAKWCTADLIVTFSREGQKPFKASLRFDLLKNTFEDQKVTDRVLARELDEIWHENRSLTKEEKNQLAYLRRLNKTAPYAHLDRKTGKFRFNYKTYTYNEAKKAVREWKDKRPNKMPAEYHVSPTRPPTPNVYGRKSKIDLHKLRNRLEFLRDQYPDGDGVTATKTTIEICFGIETLDFINVKAKVRNGFLCIVEDGGLGSPELADDHSTVFWKGDSYSPTKFFEKIEAMEIC